MKVIKKHSIAIVCMMLVACMAMMPVGAVSACGSQSDDTKKQDIVTVLANDPQYSTLVAAVKAAGLEETLKGAGPFTVFAPTNDAFSKLPKETLDDLLKPENKDKLANILTYHVFKGRVLADDAKKLVGKDITMVNGKKAKITEKKGKLFINDAKIIQPDIMASNGVIHGIDMVIIPE